MKNLEKNWLVVWNLTYYITWGIWPIFTTALKIVNIETLMGSFYPKLKMHELKAYRGVMCNETAEWWKIWGGVDLSFQNWHKEYNKFWIKYLKVSKLGLWWDPFIQSRKFKKSHGNEEWWKLWGELDLLFQNRHKEFDEFWPEHPKVSKICPLMCCVWPKYMFGLKKYRGVVW